jgi:hypothetical protein
MAQDLTGVTLTAPASDPAIDTGQTFTMSCTYTQAGHGGEESVDLHWEFATVSGGPYSAIPTSDVGSLSVTTNPTVGTDSTITHSVTVTGDGGGTYYVHIRAVGQSSAASFENGNQIVTVTAGATTTPQTVTGSLTPAGALEKLVIKSESGSMTPSGVIQKQVNLDKSGSITPSGIVNTKVVVLQSVSGAITATGSLLKRVSKSLLGSFTPSGLIAKQINKSTVGSVTPSGSILKRVELLKSGSITPTGILDTIFATMLNLAGSITLTGILNTLYVPFVGVSKAYARIRGVVRGVIKDRNEDI